MEQIKIVSLPLPNRKLSPNARVHRMAKSKITKEHRRLAAVYASHQLALQQYRVIGYKIIWVPKTKTTPDDDNVVLMCKAYRDGIADFLCQDDKTFKLYGVEFADPDKNKPRVDIMLTVES